MLSRFGLAMALVSMTLVGACTGFPRGAPFAGELNGSSLRQNEDYVFYPVTRDSVAAVAAWPAVNAETTHGWPGAGGGHLGRVVQAGDTVNVQIWDSSDNSLLTSPGSRVSSLGSMVVSPQGRIFIPYVGEVKISGMSPERAREAVQYQLGLVAPSAQVQLGLEEGAQNSFNVVSGVTDPGSFPLVNNNVSVLAALSGAGGVVPEVVNPRVKIQRGSNLFVKSLSDIYDAPTLNARVRAGDNIIVESDPRYFIALGAAGTEDLIYFTKDRVNALDAAGLMNGLDESRANPEGVLVLREYRPDQVGPGGPLKDRVIFAIDLTTADGLFSARSLEIMPEDVVLVTESPVGTLEVALGLIGAATVIESRVN